MKVRDIAEHISGIIEGNAELDISNIAKIETANPDEISFISNPAYNKFYNTTNAGAIIISNDFSVAAVRNDITLIKVKDPYLSFLDVIELFEKDEINNFTGISDNCVIGDDTEMPEDIYIGNFVSIGKNCKFGENTKIFSNCTIENGVSIGNNCIIYPNVVIYQNCKIGNNVIIHSGTVIGSDGFGFAPQEKGEYKKIPHKGIVVIEDDVEIGSNCCIDRATIGETKICKGVKLDNQIQIAHNVTIEQDTVIAAQSGIAGSTKIGKRVKMGGNSGIVGHLTICDDVTIGAMVGVSKSITSGGIYTGYRAKPIKDDLKREARINKLEILEERIKKLEGLIEEISKHKSK